MEDNRREDASDSTLKDETASRQVSSVADESAAEEGSRRSSFSSAITGRLVSFSQRLMGSFG